MKVFKGKIWAAIGSLMDHGGTASTTKSSSPAAAVPDRALLADIEAAIERCTGSSGGGGGNDDRHVHEILFLVSNEPGAITFLSRRITARLEAARAPAAALRSLLLVHRLLRAGDRYFEQDFRGLWASRELRVDAPRCSCSPLTAAGGVVHYASAGAAAVASGACAFVHGYSAYLEERMQWVINQSGNLEPARKPPPPDHDAGKLPPPPSSSSSSSTSSHDASAETLLFKLAMCQRLLDLAIQLLPDNNTSASAAARSAFGIVLRESFKVYDAFAEGVDVMLLLSRSLAGLSKPSRVTAHEILKKACAQTPELKEFYHKCKRSNASSKSLEYPLVRVVTPAQAFAMEMEPVTMTPIPEEDGCQEEKVEARAGAEAIDGGGSPFAHKMETTISTVWVEFEDEDQRLITAPTDDDHSLKAVQRS
ncbi:putative clathrin assembly protein At1g33340 [Miscanthus floridulus]|uniref:putative clathrin assembly protein At1g33340 n=1 Tax=Miscanthus floridulus TaxID=154761 RepID=UPI00345803E6